MSARDSTRKSYIQWRDHGRYLGLTGQELRIVDTLEFQRLRNLHQLQVAHLVFPGATHTRFHHSLQVCELAGRFAERLAVQQPALQISPRLVQLLRIAGLVHDLGHACFSHAFDHHIVPLLAPSLVPPPAAPVEARQAKASKEDDARRVSAAEEPWWVRHEARSAALFRHLVRKHALDYTAEEVEFVCAAVTGRPLAGRPRWHFQIVANPDSGLDVDKLCYLETDARHVGTPVDLQVDHLLDHARVIDGSICFHAKVAERLVDVFRCRAKLHRDIYLHHAVVAIEAMVIDMLAVLARLQRWHLLFDERTHAWRALDDTILDRIPELCAPAPSILSTPLLSSSSSCVSVPVAEEDQKTQPLTAAATVAVAAASEETEAAAVRRADVEGLLALYYRLRYRHLYRCERLLDAPVSPPDEKTVACKKEEKENKKSPELLEVDAGMASGVRNPLADVTCFTGDLELPETWRTRRLLDCDLSFISPTTPHQALHFRLSRAPPRT